MQLLLKEVMLDKIDFIQEKNAICFYFYNSSTGKDIGKVVCENVFKVDMNTAFLFNEEKFPCFVLDVVYGKLENYEIADYFNKLHYGFKDNGGAVIPKSDFYWYFGIEGGPIEIRILSSNIEKSLVESLDQKDLRK